MLQHMDTVGKYLEQHIQEATHPRVRNSQQGHTYMVLQCKEKLQPLLHQDKEAPHKCKYHLLPQLIQQIKTKGYELKRIDEILN